MSIYSSYCSSIYSHTPSMIKTPMQSTTTIIENDSLDTLDNSKHEKKFADDVTKALNELLLNNAQSVHNSEDEFCVVSGLNDSLTSTKSQNVLETFESLDSYRKFETFDNVTILTNENLEKLNFKFERYSKPKID